MNKKITSTPNEYGAKNVLTVKQDNGVYHITYDVESNGNSSTLFEGEVNNLVGNTAIYKYSFINKPDTIYTDGSIEMDNNLVVTYTENSENPNGRKLSFNLDTNTISVLDTP